MKKVKVKKKGKKKKNDPKRGTIFTHSGMVDWMSTVEWTDVILLDQSCHHLISVLQD